MVPDQRLVNQPSHMTRIARLGIWMRRHQRSIIALQWIVILFYVALIIIPTFLPLPDESDHLWDNLTRFSQFVFWGLWWPGVLISMLVVGRFWCGVLCPEGALSEWASRKGLQRHGFPAILKWNGWPFVAFVFTTLYGQLISVYEYPKATLLILGGSTLAAMLIGIIWGAEKRLWCRHLCPVNGVFSLLSRLAPLHFRVDQQQWDQHWQNQVQARRHSPPAVAIKPVNCAPLVNIRKMVSNSQCHMCSRCAGEHQAVRLSWRSMHDEILHPPILTVAQQRRERWLIHLLLFGMLGLSLGAFQWNVSPWFTIIKQTFAAWLIDRNWLWALQPLGHWWILTDYPVFKDILNPLDGLLILAYSLINSVIIGSVFWGALIITGRLIQQPIWYLAPRLIPFAAINLIVGLGQLFFTQLRAEGIYWSWTHHMYMTLIIIGALWSLYLIGHSLYYTAFPINGSHQNHKRSDYIKYKCVFALMVQMIAITLPISAWVLQFYYW